MVLQGLPRSEKKLFWFLNSRPVTNQPRGRATRCNCQAGWLRKLTSCLPFPREVPAVENRTEPRDGRDLISGDLVCHSMWQKTLQTRLSQRCDMGRLSRLPRWDRCHRRHPETWKKSEEPVRAVP